MKRTGTIKENETRSRVKGSFDEALRSVTHCTVIYDLNLVRIQLPLWTFQPLSICLACTLTSTEEYDLHYSPVFDHSLCLYCDHKPKQQR